MSPIGRGSRKYSRIEWTLKNRGSESDEFPNVRVYNLVHRNVHPMCVGPVWASKISDYETPYTVIGGIKLAGSKGSPKSICRDKNNGTFETVYMEKASSVKWFRGKSR